MDTNNSTSEFFELQLKGTLSDKKHITIELIKSIPVEWQLIYSYMNNASNYGSPKLHTQNYHEIIIHIQSKRRFLAGSKLYEAGHGDILIFPAGVPHKGIDLARAIYERHYIYINPALLSYLPDGEAIASCFTAESPNIIRLESERRNSLLHELTELNRIATNNDICPDHFRLRIFIQRVLYEILHGQNTPQFGIAPPPLLKSMMDYIGREYAAIATSSAVAAHFGVSESYMSRLFRDSLQISPYQYIQSIRLIEAKRLLHEGQSVTDACFGAGFSDCSHFIAYFRKCVGVTPNKYKNSPRG